MPHVRVARSIVSRIPGGARIAARLDARLGPPHDRRLVELEPGTVSLDLRDSAHRRLWWGVYERAEAKLVRSLLPPGGTFVDIGANAGWYTLLGARAVGPTGTVHAFEPVPSTLELLRETVAANGLENVTIHAVAAADVEGTAAISIDREHQSGWASLVYLPDTRDRIEVRTVSISRFLLELGVERADLIKLDVEGAEPAILGDLRPRLRELGAAILCELDPALLALSGSSPEAVVNDLRSIGFRAFDVRARPVELRPGEPPRGANVLFRPDASD